MQSDCPTCCACLHRRIATAGSAARKLAPHSFVATLPAPTSVDVRVSLACGETDPGLSAGQFLLRILVTAAPTVCLPFRESRHRLLPGSQDFPRPKAHSRPPRCIGLPECTQLRLLKGRVHMLMSAGGLSGVRFPLVLIACHRDKPSPIVWISRCPRTLSVARCGLDLIQKKVASACGLDSYCEMPVAG